MSVVGNSGSGKTTLARTLAGHLGVPHVELDSLVHQPGWQELPTEELRARLAPVLAGEGWVVDGNYRSRVGDLVREAADTVVWLDLPRWLVTSRVVRRTARRAVTREELWNGNREQLRDVLSRDPMRSIVRWSWTQHEAYRRQYSEESAAPANAHLRYVRLSSRRQVRELLAAAVPSSPG